MFASVYDRATVNILWRRDLRRFWRQPSRLLGALGQPIIFWVVIGGGMTSTFHLQGSDIGYLEYFYPGVILLAALFTSIFASVSVIDDRHQGFLQAVLAGPGSRASLVLGKCLGSASVALVQIIALLALAPLAGFDLWRIDWLGLLAILSAATLGLSALGFAMAWWLDNVQAYHAIQMTFLMPLWVVSGAMFPTPENSTLFRYLMLCNPLAYAVTAVRHALYGGAAPGLLVAHAYFLQAVAVVVGFAVASLLLAVMVARRQ